MAPVPPVAAGAVPVFAPVLTHRLAARPSSGTQLMHDQRDYRVPPDLNSCRLAGIAFALGTLLSTIGCTSQANLRTPEALERFGTRYVAAWSSHDADRVAGFFAASGSLTVNSAPPASGRAAIRATVQSYVTAFPDLTVTMDRMVVSGDRAVLHWTFVGKNSGPGGTGRRVRLSGYEEWSLDRDGLVAASLGHFDAADYERQLRGDPLPAGSSGQCRAHDSRIEGKSALLGAR